jgi:chromosome partitioning protein
MQIITVTSLSGGQGKTTVTFLLGRLLAESKKVLVGDADPQSNLTFYVGHQVETDSPTFLELITGEVEPQHSVYPTNFANLYVIPSDGAFTKAQDYLANSGMGAAVLRQRLKKITKLFDYCIIDSPPQRSQICMTAMGAANWLLIPVEASTKGVNSLIRTLEMQQELQDLDAFTGEVLGIIPFRDRWFGRSQSTDSRDAIAAMQQIAGGITIFPSIPESEQYKKAVRKGMLLKDAGFPELEYPLSQVIAKL